jgi:hypothetical protein
VAALDAWIGHAVEVSVASRDQGRVHSRQRGVLSRSADAAEWTALDGPDGEAVGFQVGPDRHAYFVLYRNAFTQAFWVSRKHGFLMSETALIDLGVALTHTDT